MLHQYRKHDAVIVICQNNVTKTVEIAALNERAQALVGHRVEDLVGKPLVPYLSPKLAELITDDLVYNDAGFDLGDVLSKTYEIQFLNKSGDYNEFRLRLVRSEAVDRNPVFHLVLQEERVYREHEAFKKVLSENFKGHEVIDEDIGLPTRHSLVKDLELVQYYTLKNQFSACFAVIEMDNYEAMHAKHGDDFCKRTLAHIGQLCRQRLRKEDAIGVMSTRSVGMVLMQITPESSRLVLNRLKLSIHAMPMLDENGRKVETSVNISFTMLSDEDQEQLMIRAEKALINTRGKSHNQLLEV